MHTLQSVPNPYIRIISKVDFRQNLCPIQIHHRELPQTWSEHCSTSMPPIFSISGDAPCHPQQVHWELTANMHIIITETGVHNYASWYLEYQRQSQVTFLIDA